MIDISVVIATYNRSESLKQTLDSLLAQQEADGILYEIIVVDNNSNDGTKDLVCGRYLKSNVPLRYLFEPRQGKSIALNRAVHVAKGMVLAFTDDDVVLSPQWLNRVHAFFQADQGEAVQGRILLSREISIPSWVGREVLERLAITDLGEASCAYEKGLVGANMALQAKVFRECGYFREDLGPGRNGSYGGEDNELSKRIRKAGFRQIYSPEMVAYHRIEPWRFEKRYLRKFSFQQGYSAARFMKPELTKGQYLLYQLKQMLKDLFVFALKCLKHEEKGAFQHEVEVFRRIGIIKGLMTRGSV